MDRASQVLPQGVPKSYPALADHHRNISHSTLHHRARGRPSIADSQISRSQLGLVKCRSLESAAELKSSTILLSFLTPATNHLQWTAIIGTY